MRAFVPALRDLGYVEGDNLVIDTRSADIRPERLPALAAELVRLKVDVIITVGDGELRAAKQATTTIHDCDGLPRRSGRSRLYRESRPARRQHHRTIVGD